MKRKVSIFIFTFFLSSGISFSQGTWTPKKSFAMSRCLMSAFAIGSKGYIGTGNTPTTGAYADLWEYDPVTDTWTQMANLPSVARKRGVGFSVAGKGYIMGGVDNASTTCLNDLWEFDPVLNSWVQKANLPGPGRFGAIGFSVGNKGYVGTGFDVTTNQYYKDLWEYDPTSNTWTAKADFGGGLRAGAVTFVVGNKAYAGMGNDTTNNFNDLWEYDPAANSWTPKANLPAPPRTYPVGITIFNRGYVGTGADTSFYEDWFEYNPATNTWAPMLDFQGGARYHMIGFGINCRGYIGTGHWGYNQSIWYADWWEFTPADFYFASINSAGSQTICSGNSATLVAVGGVSYVWNTGATSSSIVVSPTGTTTYSVIASTAAPLACTSTASITVTVKALNIATSVAAINCASTSNNGTANATVNSGGTPPYTYFWSPINQTNATATGLAPYGNYTVVVSDSKGCSVTSPVTMTQYNAPMAVISGVKSICLGGATTLTASGAYNYLWGNGSTSASIVVSPSATTTYSVIASVGICNDTTSATVMVYNPPVASAYQNTTVCTGTSVSLSASGGSAAPYTYTWNTGVTGTAITVTPTTTTTYSILISIGTCKDSANVTVATVPSPTATVTGNIILCTGDITTLTATGGINYSWSNSSNSSSIVVSPPVTTTYSVIANNGFCDDTALIIVNVSPPPVVHITGSNNICQGDSAMLVANGGNLYLWSTGETTTAIYPDSAGTYSVVASIGTCTDTTFTNVNVNQLPTANVSPDVTIVQGQSTDLSASGGVNYIWTDGSIGAGNTVSPQYSAEYCVTVFDANNCKDTACVKVHVVSCETAGELYLPNAFSPNGDGENDELQVYFGLFDCIQSFHLVIYNRWGEKVYETSDALFKWNGVYNTGILKDTQVADTEVFVYRMDVTLGDMSKISRKGNISLVR